MRFPSCLRRWNGIRICYFSVTGNNQTFRFLHRLAIFFQYRFAALYPNVFPSFAPLSYILGNERIGANRRIRMVAVLGGIQSQKTGNSVVSPQRLVPSRSLRSLPAFPQQPRLLCIPPNPSPILLLFMHPYFDFYIHICFVLRHRTAAFGH